VVALPSTELPDLEPTDRRIPRARGCGRFERGSNPIKFASLAGPIHANSTSSARDELGQDMLSIVSRQQCGGARTIVGVLPFWLAATRVVLLASGSAAAQGLTSYTLQELRCPPLLASQQVQSRLAFLAHLARAEQAVQWHGPGAAHPFSAQRHRLRRTRPVLLPCVPKTRVVPAILFPFSSGRMSCNALPTARS
jgi:hypothetical protein